MQTVKSSLIESVGHDPETNTLTIRFKNTRSTFTYANVTPAQYAELLAAESIGGHFIRNFRHNKEHPATKVEDKKEGE